VRRTGGWLLVLLGVLLVLLGCTAAVVFGPDNEVASGPHPFASDGTAIATAPEAIQYAGPTVRITLVSSSGRPLFVGLAHDVDVHDYLAGSAYTRVDTLDLPWETTSSRVGGQHAPGRRPAALDWWLVSDTGPGKTSVTFTLPNDSVDVVVTNADLRPRLRVQATVTVLRPGVFVGGLAAVLAGLGIAAVGVVLVGRVRARAARRQSAPGRADRAEDSAAGSPR
jgi:hypothetical protein